MTKTKKKTTKKALSKPLYKRPGFIVLFLLVFVTVGSIVVVTNAEGKTPKVSRRTQQRVLLSYSDEKPAVVQFKDGKTEYVSRPRTISVTSDNSLYCTPENNGDITTRRLNSNEQSQVNAQIEKSRSNTQSQDTSDQNSANVNTYRGIVVRDGGTFKKAQFRTRNIENDSFKQSVNFLESLCSQPSNQIKEEEAPRVVASAQKSESLAQKAYSVVLPKAEAGGAVSNTGEILDTEAETYQHIRLAQYRAQNGLAATTRDSCLDNWAREWAKQMAKDRWMRHSDLIVQYMNNCQKAPNGYVGRAVIMGENIGSLTNLSIRDDADYSHYISNLIFNGYVNSPLHNANMLNRQFQFHGIGAYKTADKSQIYMVQAFRYNEGYGAK